MVLAGCSASKYVQEGEYILNKVEVKSDSAAYDAGALKQYVRQKEKPKLFSLFNNPFSKKPVVYDELQAQLSCRDLLTAMQNQGFMHAGVSLHTEIHGEEKTNRVEKTDGVEKTDSLANKSRKKAPKVDVTYMLHPGEPFHIGKVEYDIEDKNIEQILKLDEPENQKLKPGMRFTVDALDAERKRIANLLLNDGYFRFNKDFIQFSADTIAGQKDIAVTLNLLKYKANSSAPETDHPRYEIRNINYLSNDSDRIHLRHRVLLNATAMEEGKPYSASALQRTYNNFARLQAVKYTNISFKEVTDAQMDNVSDSKSDSKSGSISDSTVNRLLDCNIQISTNKPSNISFQPEGTNTAGDLGAAASLTYTNRNLFRGSEQLSIELRGAYEAITGLEGYQDQNYQEYSVEGKVVFPRFMAPFLSKNFRRRQTANSELSVSWDLQNRPEFHRRVFSTAWRYRWTEPRHHLAWRFDLLDLNYVYMPWISETFKRDYLDDADNRNAILRYNYEDLFIMKIGFGLTYSAGWLLQGIEVQDQYPWAEHLPEHRLCAVCQVRFRLYPPVPFRRPQCPGTACRPGRGLSLRQQHRAALREAIFLGRCQLGERLGRKRAGSWRIQGQRRAHRLHQPDGRLEVRPECRVSNLALLEVRRSPVCRCGQHLDASQLCRPAERTVPF